MNCPVLRRLIHALILAMLAAGPLQAGDEPPAAAAAPVALDVYKSPTCGCCGGWIEHIEARGFRARIHQPPDLAAVKQDLGLPNRLQSCHTAVSAEGYVFEGHIPATVIARFLADPPVGAVGLTVPGMPVGSPGMESGDRFMPYQVLLLRESGEVEVYAEIRTREEQY